MEQHARLPFLENVEASGPKTGKSRSVWNLFYFCFAIQNMYACLTEKATIQAYYPALAVIFLAYWLLDFCVISVRKWRTDSRGITAIKLLSHRLIRWEDIIEVRPENSYSFVIPVGYTLVTNCGKLYLPAPVVMPRQYAIFLASVYQHLTPFEKQDKIALPKEVENLWWQIPDSVPNEVNWTNPFKPSWKALQNLLIIKLLVLSTASVLLVRNYGWHSAGTAVILLNLSVGAVTVLLYSTWYSNRTTAYRANVSESGIEAETSFGAFFFTWEEISRASWSATGSGTLHLRSGHRHVSIPAQNNSAMLLLSIMRNLRRIRKWESISIPKNIQVCAKVNA